MNKRLIHAVAAGAVFFAACGSDSDGDSGASEDTSSAATDAPDAESTDDLSDEPAEESAAESAQESAVEFAEDIVDGLEATQAAEGGGGATLTVDGETWEFPSVLCAFGEDEIGQEGAVFVLSAIDDGLQLYVSIDDSGESHSLSLNDTEDFENPSVSLSANQFTMPLDDPSTQFLNLDGTSVSGEVVMMDEGTGERTAEPAQLSGTCP